MKFIKSKIFLILIVGLFVRLLFSPFGTLNLDQGTFIAWSNILVSDGFRNFYNGWSDYLPGYLYFLWGLGKINLLHIFPSVVLYKLPSIFADIATGYLIYKILVKTKSEKWALIGTSIYIFNLAVMANSTFWGQADSMTALTSVLSLYLLPTHFILSALTLSVGTLIKPQTAFVFPIVLFLMVKNKWKIEKIFVYCLMGLALFVLAFIPFWNHGNIASFITERLGTSFHQYPYTSINAFNFWGLGGFWKTDSIFLQVFGYSLVAASTLFLSIKLWSRKNAAYYLLAFIFGAIFIFFTRMHERHLLPVLAPLTVITIENPLFAIPLLGFSISYLANLYYSYVWINNDFKQIFSDFVIKTLSILNVSFLVFIFYSVFRGASLKWGKVLPSLTKFFRRKSGAVLDKLPETNLTGKGAKLILSGILIFAFLTRISELRLPPNEYFDEVYHAFTAKVILHNDPKAWEWWNTPPEGFAYEWTHPPLAKLGMLAGMKIFGENAFGYRIPGALLGLGAVFLVYLLTKNIFKDEMIALISAAAFSLDGLALVMSRIAMNDSYLLFFSLISIYFFIKKRDFWSALSFGFAIASKWSAVWVIPILGILWLWRKKKFTPSILWFVLFPFAIYILSYLPMFLTGHELSVWWEMQKQMWWYHTGLVATHPYTSQWWSWPLLIRPIYLYTSDEAGGMVARIYAFGNPLVFWFGLASVFSSLAYAYIERNKQIAFVVFAYLIFFVPWALSPRIMFLYHYLPSIPFLSIATGYVLRRNPKLIKGYLIIGLLMFIYFYPHWAGLQVPLWLDKSYYWVNSWR